VKFQNEIKFGSYFLNNSIFLLFGEESENEKMVIASDQSNSAEKDDLE